MQLYISFERQQFVFFTSISLSHFVHKNIKV